MGADEYVLGEDVTHLLRAPGGRMTERPAKREITGVWIDDPWEDECAATWAHVWETLRAVVTCRVRGHRATYFNVGWRDCPTCHRRQRLVPVRVEPEGTMLTWDDA